MTVSKPPKPEKTENHIISAAKQIKEKLPSQKKDQKRKAPTVDGQGRKIYNSIDDLPKTGFEDSRSM